MSDAARLTLWDDGKGLPEDRPSGTGMQLIAGFARQLGAEVAWGGEGGTSFVLTLPVEPAATE